MTEVKLWSIITGCLVFLVVLPWHWDWQQVNTALLAGLAAYSALRAITAK